MSALLLVKNAVCALGLSDLFGLVEYCHDCGARVREHWWAHPELWYAVARSGDGGVLCIPCFDARCERDGIRVRWTPVLQQRRDAQGRWTVVPPPDPELYPVAARLHAEARS